MDDSTVDEECIDLGALQAQIDLSMSFATDLVTSWIKPSHRLSSKGKDTEAELREYMRRPPRLGVGTPIPETVHASRETARLKTQLFSMPEKRLRAEKNTVGPTQDLDDDQEESRAAVIKKKAKVDPFRGPDSSTRLSEQKGNEKVPDAKALVPSSLPHPEEEGDRSGVVRSATEHSPVKQDTDSAWASVTLSLCSSRDEIDSSLPETGEMQLSQTADNATRLANFPVTYAGNKRPATEKRGQRVTLLKRPLLNLKPLLDEDHSGGDDQPDSLSNTPTRKKKRKRARKKRHDLLAGLVGNATPA